jgi:ATP-dependent DNA ligase
LLGYYESSRLVYAGRAGTGLTEREIGDLRQRLEPLAVAKMPLAAPPPPDSRFGRPLELKRVHWVRPELVVEVTFLTWTDDRLLRHCRHAARLVELAKEATCLYAKKLRRQPPSGTLHSRLLCCQLTQLSEGIARLRVCALPQPTTPKLDTSEDIHEPGST